MCLRTAELRQWWESVSGSGEWAKRAALNAGMFYAQRDDFAAAAPLFRKASAFEDSQEAATAFYFLGLAERALGNGIGAAEAMRRAMALGDSKVQAEARRAVANLERRGF